MKYKYPKLKLDKPVEPVKLPERLEIKDLDLDPDGKIAKQIADWKDYQEKTKNINVGEY
jgi:hypothetical protein